MHPAHTCQVRRVKILAVKVDSVCAPDRCRHLNVWAVVYEPGYVPPPVSDELAVEEGLPTLRLQDGDGDGVDTSFDRTNE